MWRFYIFLNVLTLKIIKSKIKGKDILVSSKQYGMDHSRQVIITCWTALEKLWRHFIPIFPAQPSSFNCSTPPTKTLTNFQDQTNLIRDFIPSGFPVCQIPSPSFFLFPNAFRHWNSLASFPYIWKSKSIFDNNVSLIPLLHGCCYNHSFFLLTLQQPLFPSLSHPHSHSHSLPIKTQTSKTP